MGRVVGRVMGGKVMFHRWAGHVWVWGVGWWRREPSIWRSEHHLWGRGRGHVVGRGTLKPHSVLHHHLVLVVRVRWSWRQMMVACRIWQLGQLWSQQQWFRPTTRLLLGLPRAFTVALVTAVGGASYHGSRLADKHTCRRHWPPLRSSHW